MSKLQEKIEDVARRFAETIVETIRGVTLDELAGMLGPTRGAATAPAPSAGGPKGSGPRVESAKQRAARKLQGSYIGLLRKFAPREKLAYKRIAREQSVAAAIGAMKKKLGRV